MSETKTKATRKCSHCGKKITEGYVIDGGDEYYCPDRVQDGTREKGKGKEKGSRIQVQIQQREVGMKRDKLTPIELECNMGKDVNGVEHREPWKAYDIDEVDALLAEKDAEIAELKQKLEDVNELIKTTRKMLEDAKATAYTENVDAGMRERRLKRALWIHRAIVAKLNKEGCKEMRAYNPFIGIQEYQWERVEAKCRTMAEKFK